MSRASGERFDTRLTRSDFRIFRSVPTRWMDNDAYGHVNNVVYYSWFDTAVNAWLIERGLLDLAKSSVIGLVAETACTYFESIAFPETVETGLAVSRLGNSAVTYRIGVFRPGHASAAAQGRFTHVHVDKETRRPVAIPVAARLAMEEILISS